MTRLLIVAYLFAIVAANLSLERWGPTAVIWNAAILIGLDLTARDRLADVWRRNLARNMALLIAAGSLLSVAVNRDTWRIALASGIAFGAAAVADTVAYQLLQDRPWFQRVNQSNLFGATVDSLLFLPIAFGVFPWTTMFAQACAKVAGGVVWASLLQPFAVFRAPPMGPVERLRYHAWGQAPASPRSDYPYQGRR
jgi:queuosine precursor transporter